MLVLKPTVKGPLDPVCLQIVAEVYRIYRFFGYTCTVSSGNDGTHCNPCPDGKGPSQHYAGKALDFSIKWVPLEIREAIVTDIKSKLGAAFDVRWEARGTDNEHLHIEEER